MEPFVDLHADIATPELHDVRKEFPPFNRRDQGFWIGLLDKETEEVRSRAIFAGLDTVYGLGPLINGDVRATAFVEFER